MTMFELEPVATPVKLSADARRTAKRRRMIAEGFHPFGGKIHEEEGRTCGTCIYRIQKVGGRRWWKWTKQGEISASAATDVVLSWPGCQLHCAEGESTRCPTCEGRLYEELTDNDRAYHKECPWNWVGRGRDKVYVGPTRKRCGTCLGTGSVRRSSPPEPSDSPGCGS